MGKTKGFEESLSQCFTDHHKFYIDWPDHEPELHCEKPASYGMAYNELT
jgi:hypothetical protein